MRVRSLFVAVPVAAVLMSGIAGCGSGASPGKIKTADDAGKPSASESTASGTGRQGPPRIDLPDGIDEFVDWMPDEPRQRAILHDVRERIRAMDAAIVHGANPDDEAVAFYTKGQALAGAKKWIGGYRRDGLTVGGTVRYGAARVIPRTTTASLTYCADETKAYDLDRKTKKKKDGVVDDAQAFVFYEVNVEKNKEGVWQTSSVQSKRGGCRL